MLALVTERFSFGECYFDLAVGDDVEDDHVCSLLLRTNSGFSLAPLFLGRWQVGVGGLQRTDVNFGKV